VIVDLPEGCVNIFASPGIGALHVYLAVSLRREGG